MDLYFKLLLDCEFVTMMGLDVTVGVYVIAPLFQTPPWKEYCDFVTMMGLDVTVGVYVIAPLIQTPPW